MKARKVLGCALGLLLLAMGLQGCGGGDGDGSKVLLETTVTVGAGGGGATVFFQGESGKTIRIVLTSAATMRPYGFLEPPSGNAAYVPSLDTAQPGSNSAEVPLTVTGQFSFTVFDGENVGGQVQVEITQVE